MAISTKRVSGEETIHYTPSRKQRKKAKTNIQPPLTPMIDVTFQLLLFFILTCEFRESEGNIPGTLPLKGNVVQVVDQPPPPKPITIKMRATMDRKATYEMTGIATVIDGPKRLYECLKARQDQLQSDEVPVVIQPRPDVPWEYVVQAFNQAVRAKFKKIGFAEESL